MCTPELAAKGALGASAGATAYETIGSYYAASGERIGLKAQAALADTNARLAELNARQEMISGSKQYAKQRLEVGAMKSAARASFAARGVTLDSDSVLNVQTTTDVIGEADANAIMSNAARAAWGYRTQAVNYQNEALMLRTKSKGINPFFRAGSTLLTGAESVYKAYDRYQTVTKGKGVSGA